MKSFIALLVAVALAAGGWFWWQKQHPTSASVGTGPGGRPTTATIETRSIHFAVSAAGEITPSEQVSVRPEVNGKILVLTVDVSDLLKKDQLLFQLDDRDLQIEKRSQETLIARGKLELGQAERNFQRARQLYDSRLIALELIEDEKTKFELAKNSLERAQTALDQVNDKLRKTRVTAPFDCTVLTRPISVGQAVSGSGGFNSGTEVLTIANLNDLVINAHINQADVTRLRVNQEVEVTVEAVPGLKVIGRVERLAPQATIKNSIKGFAARILLKDVDRRIRPGMTANILIPVASADSVVAAPLAAVFTEMNPDTRQMERYAFVQNGEEWERRPIQIGVSDYFVVEVTKGLAAGEVVSLEDKNKDRKPGAPGKAPPAAATRAAGAGTPSTGSGTRPAPATGSATTIR
ncbi:MAG: efflux RND transporter periplasmic adaptor subunit [Pedosphaera sp.]|nr:efflux RND transporter periplasmic adaptor subunit [Pedosphaera sp.]